ncbi:MAG: hypothetical protein PUC39_02460, partial [Lachnospiraceae bacterium]|nr:hypothetical protein [Lachnospiraceae bacterium]
MKKIRVSIYNIKPGMRAAGDVYSSTGQLLVPNGATFTDETLERLNLYSIPFVTIYADEDNAESEQVLPANASYAERIKNSTEFQHFQSEFTNSLSDVNQSLQHIVTSSEDIDVDALLEQTTHLLTHGSTTIGILDMVNNLRSY